MKRRLAIALVALVCLAVSGCAGSNSKTFRPEILVGSADNGEILRYDAHNGTYLGIFASGGLLQSPEGMGQLDSGDVVVGDFVTHHILRYSQSGRFLADMGALNGTPYGLLAIGFNDFLVSEFDSLNPLTGKKSGRIVRYTPQNGFQTFIQDTTLNGPDGLSIGPDGFLYVSSQNSAQILKYDSTGTLAGVFSSGSPMGAPNAGPSGNIFGPDNNLYVAQHDTNPVATTNGMVLRYNGRTGAFLDQVVPKGAGGLSGPIGVLFTPEGDLLVTSAATNQVLRFSLAGQFLGVFATSPNLKDPFYLAGVYRQL